MELIELTCDFHAGQIQRFFRYTFGSFEWISFFLPYLNSLRPGKYDFCQAPDVGGVAKQGLYAKHFEVEMVVCDNTEKQANEQLLQCKSLGFEGKRHVF